jgi:hypothetical protein
MKINITLIGIIFVFFSAIQADNRIVLYLKHAPAEALAQAEKDAFKQSLATRIAQLDNKTPGELSRSAIKYSLKANTMPPLSGFVAVYAGYMDISDMDGLLAFPLRHAIPKVFIAITPEIKLVNIKGNTFSHREFINDQNNPCQLFMCEIKQDEKNYRYWEVNEIEIPADKKINPLTVVLLTHPENIFIPTGIFMATPNAQMILPDIYVIGRKNNEDALLKSLDIRRYFEQITIEQKKAAETSVQQMITNI